MTMRTRAGGATPGLGGNGDRGAGGKLAFQSSTQDTAAGSKGGARIGLRTPTAGLQEISSAFPRSWDTGAPAVP